MVSYGKGQQQMNTAWLIARKWDRIDMGEYSLLAMFRKLEVLFWAHRALNPSETREEEDKRRDDEGDTFRTIPELIISIDNRIKSLKTPDANIKMIDDSLNFGETTIENQLSGIGSELWEITVRCKLIDNVRVSEEAAP
jgi:hypothetical protein